MQQVSEEYQQTEVGVIPEDWKVVELGGIGKNLIGLTYSPNDVVEYGTLVLRSSNVQNNKLAFKNNVFVNMELPNRVIVKEGDILICVRNGSKKLIGKCALIDKKIEGVAFGAFMSIYRSEFGSFIFYQFQSNIIQRQIDEIMGATINQITNKDMAVFKVPLPNDVKEQAAIANALSDVDALITSLEKLIAKKRAIKTAAMQQLLTGKKRLPPFDQAHTGYKQTELGEIPEDWEVVVLEDVIGFNNGAAHENAITKYGEYTVVNSKFISTEGAVAKYSSQLLCPTKKGNVLMVMSDVPNGRAMAKCFLVDEENKYTVNQRICSIEPLNVESKFLFYILNRNKFYLQFDDGVKQTNLRRQDVLECPIPLPSFQEQAAISMALTEMNNDIAALDKRLIKTQQLKQGMMQELLTGRTRLL